ncbi:MAG TPA: ribonuclease H-like domain-containing protein [Vicinamibacterales bacterium]|nr:ribonuclease H-like domain-containing protein [Vicinamibacterales bacterium]
MSSLADRIRAVVGATHPRPSIADCDPPSPPPTDAPPLSALGGEWRGGVFVVERRMAPIARHGREAIGSFAECLDAASTQAMFYAGGAPAQPPFVFFDLETTGLSGGAGTQVFLVGCGWFEADASFATRQFLLTRHADERQLLASVADELDRAGALVSFNGKSFDAPVLETRYLFHRLPTNVRALPHVDVLHPARRFWKLRDGVASPFHSSRPGADACSLVALEKQLLGVRRVGDVPGIEIPSRYFRFVRTGDPRPLTAVLEHNRLDLLTLAALTARLLHVTLHGPDAARDAREALALGHVYMRADLVTRAADAYARAVEMTERGIVSQVVRIESLRALALTYRRERNYAAAAACWRRLLDTPGCPALVTREATEALAVHHEHRERDLFAAKAFALRSLEVDTQPAWTRAVQHRLARLEKKLKLSERPGLLLS